MKVRFAQFGWKVTVAIVVLAAAQPALGATVGADDVTRGRGISNEATMTFGSAWVDHDLDGDVDLFLNRHWMRPWLYVARGDRYDVAEEDFVSVPGYESPTPDQVDRHHCMWGEADGDGSPDLYCAVGAQSGRGRGPNQLVMRTESGWVERARQFGIANTLGRGRAVNWVDFDGDRDLDLFVGNGKRKGYPNKLFRNDRGSFRSVDAGLAQELRTLTSSWADWDADGDLDLLVTRGNLTGFRGARPVAYENRNGRFVRHGLRGVTQQRWTSVAWADVDDDGLIDLALVRSKRVRVLRNLGGRFTTLYSRRLARGRSVVWMDWDNDTDLDLFVVQGATGGPDTESNAADLLLVNIGDHFKAVRKAPLRGPRKGNGEAAVVSDFDRDGRVDLFVTNGNNPTTWRGRSTLLRNRSTVRNWAGLDLNGGRWNPLAIGAIVEVTPEGRPYRRFVTDGAGYKSQSEVGYVHLGLGPSEQAMVTVLWHGGGRDCALVRAGRIRELTRGSSPCSP